MGTVGCLVTGWAACHAGEPLDQMREALGRYRAAPRPTVGRILLSRVEEARTRAELEHAGPGKSLEEVVDDLARHFGYERGEVVITDEVEVG